MTMIEKLARAVCRYNGGTEYNWEAWTGEVIAVLTALREPELILRDDQGVIHEVRGAPADFFRMCIDHILQEADRD